MNNATVIYDDIVLSPLLKSFATLKQFYQDTQTEQERAGTIQAFGYNYELAWKMMKRVLGKLGVSVYSPRDVFRAAAQQQLIDDPEVWFAFIKLRNLTVHTYDEQTAEQIFKQIPQFIAALEQLITRLQQR